MTAKEDARFSARMSIEQAQTLMGQALEEMRRALKLVPSANFETYVYDIAREVYHKQNRYNQDLRDWVKWLAHGDNEDED